MNFLFVYFLQRKIEFGWSMFFVGPIRDLFSQFKNRKQIFVLQTSKFRQISKSQDDIHMTLGLSN